MQSAATWDHYPAPAMTIVHKGGQLCRHGARLFNKKEVFIGYLVSTVCGGKPSLDIDWPAGLLLR